MADRQLPDLRTRLRIDDSDLNRTKRGLEDFQRTASKPVTAPTAGWEGVLTRNAADLQKVGSSLTRFVTLPALAAGVAAGKLANDFDTTFNRMVSVAGVSRGEVQGLQEDVLALARETGRAPQELAEGLEAIRSAGINGAEAIDVLRSASQAAAVGLGDTRSVADAVTSVISSYGSANITAAEATDILIASVQEAKVEASEIAPQLGRLLPVADALGVGFNEVGGSLAYLTRGSGDAAQASTQLLGIMQKLLNPSIQAQKALEGTGLNAAGLRRIVREDGLLAALQELEQAFDGDRAALARYLEDQQGIQGAFAILKGEGKGAAQVIDTVTESTGKGAAAFEEWLGTDASQLSRSIADLQATAIEFGQEFIPLVADIVGGVADIAQAFNDLPAPIRNGLLALVVLGGPVTSVLGRMSRGLELLRTTAAGATGAVRGFNVASAASRIGTLATGAGAAAALIGAMSVQIRDAAKSAKELREEAEATGKSVEEISTQNIVDFAAKDGSAALLAKAKVSVTELRDEIQGLDEDGVDVVTKILQAYGENNTSNVAGLEKFASEIGDLQKAYQDGVRVQERAEKIAGELGIATDETTDATESNTAAVEDNADAQGELLGLMQEQIDAAFASTEGALAWADAVRSQEQAMADLAEAEAAAIGQGEEFDRIAQRVADATEARADAVADGERAVADAQRDSLRAQEDLTRARLDASEALEDLRFANERAGISEQRARFGVEDAQAALAEVLDNPLSSDREKEEARLALQEAELSLREALDGTSDAQRDLTEAEANGVEGSPGVIAAKEAIAEASERERAAILETSERVKEAEADLAEAALARVTAIEEAQAKLPELRDNALGAALDVAKATATIAGGVEGAIAALLAVADKLEPGSPIRENIAAFIKELQGAVNLAATAPGDPYGYDPSSPEYREPERTFSGGKRGLGDIFGGGSLIVDPLPESPGGRSISGGVMVAAGAVQVPIMVTGQPDAATLQKLRRVAQEGTQEALDGAVRGVA